MNRIQHRIQRCLAVLAGLSGTLLAFAAVAPAALAVRMPPPGGSRFHPARPPTVTVVAGGMPGWQITLIAVGAALAAAALAVLIDRAWAARRRATATAA
jgi:hypothetical protein